MTDRISVVREALFLCVRMHAVQQASCCLVCSQQTVRNAMLSLRFWLNVSFGRSFARLLARAYHIYTIYTYRTNTAHHTEEDIGWLKATIVSFRAFSQLSDIVLKRRSWMIEPQHIFLFQLSLFGIALSFHIRENANCNIEISCWLISGQSSASIHLK